MTDLIKTAHGILDDLAASGMNRTEVVTVCEIVKSMARTIPKHRRPADVPLQAQKTLECGVPEPDMMEFL